MKRYSVNEMFVAPQGEGVRAGILHVFVRLAGCNLSCSKDGPEGFDCDTDFSRGRAMTAAEIVEAARAMSPRARWALVTGGEPSLQLDDELVSALNAADFLVAVESNGTGPIPHAVSWLTVSPKTAEHTIRPGRPIDELKYVLSAGKEPPKTSTKAEHYLLSPPFDADGRIDRAALRWILAKIEEHPRWRLSLQTHKWIGVR